MLEKLEEQLNCSICLGTQSYSSASMSTADNGLVPLVDRDQQGQLGQLGLTCPICRQVTPIPGRGVAGLQLAFHIYRFLEINESFQNPAATPEEAEPTDVKPSMGTFSVRFLSASFQKTAFRASSWSAWVLMISSLMFIEPGMSRINSLILHW